MEKVEKSILDKNNGNKYDAAMVKQLWFEFLNNQGNFINDNEKYYTDLNYRNKSIKRETADYNIDNIEII